MRLMYKELLNLSNVAISNAYTRFVNQITMLLIKKSTCYAEYSERNINHNIGEDNIYGSE